MHTSFTPDPEFRERLDFAIPEQYDFVAYCANCKWIGTTNSAHVKTSTCPECWTAGVRIWG